MTCSDLSIRYTAGDCNEDNTRTYTITVQNPSPVEPVELYIDFENDGTYDVGPETLTAGGTAGDSYTTTHDYMSGMTHRLHIHFIMPDGSECDDYRDIAVESCCCLEITDIDVDDDCDTDDCTRDVEIEVENCGTADVTVTEIDWGDGTVETLPSAENPTATIAAGSDEEFEHAYDATATATYNATFTFDICDDLVSDDITIDSCDCDEDPDPDDDCPTVAVTWGSESRCDEDCEKSIDVTVDVTADTSLSYEIEFTLGSSVYTLTGTGNQSFGPYTATGAPGDTVTAVAEVISPEGCDGSRYPSSHTFSGCDCPNIDIDFEEGDCKGRQREVTVSAIVDGSCTSESINASLLVEGVEVATGSGSGSVTLSNSNWYTIGATITAEVRVTTPADCDGENKSHTVTECDTTTTTTEEDTCETAPICCWLCWLVTIFGSIFAFSGAASLAGAFLPYSPYVSAGVGFLWAIFLIWAYLRCDECFITECVLKGFALAFLVTLVLLILAAFGLFTVATVVQLAWMLLIIGLVFAAFYALYQANCP